jgi:hypothetical protein
MPLFRKEFGVLMNDLVEGQVMHTTVLANRYTLVDSPLVLVPFGFLKFRLALHERLDVAKGPDE